MPRRNMKGYNAAGFKSCFGCGSRTASWEQNKAADGRVLCKACFSKQTKPKAKRVPDKHQSGDAR